VGFEVSVGRLAGISVAETTTVPASSVILATAVSSTAVPSASMLGVSELSGVSGSMPVGKLQEAKNKARMISNIEVLRRIMFLPLLVMDFILHKL
jgi:hypothetical protein